MKLANWFFILAFAVPLTGTAQNLVSSAGWTTGSGSIGIFNQNGTSAQNVRELGTGPDGTQTILWKAVADAANSSDGGWDTQPFTIDRTKLYRFSIWIKKTNSADGTTYFGCSSNDILNLNGTVNTNPYFWLGDLPELNKWYLLVGYVHSADDPSTTSYGAIYDGVTGSKVISATDFKFSSTSTTAAHRTYLYYDLTTSDRQYFYGPEVYQSSTNQPTVETTGSTYSNGDAFFSKKVGIGTANPSGNFHIHSKTPEMFLTTEDWAAIRGNGGMWLFGYSGAAGNEDISMGAQAGTGSRTLTFAAGGVARMKILSSGYVGIGTTTPQSPLHIRNATDGEDLYSGIRFTGARSAAEAISPAEHYHRIAGFRRNGLWISGSSSGSSFARSHILLKDEGLLFSTSDGTINPETNVKVFISNAGNVGIGTTTPNQKLTVNGIIYGKQVKVDLSVPGPDYVFENEYKLPSLEEIKKFIDQNRHLPEVPSAKEMEANGINVGEMNMILLKKIEELTLYLLEQQKQLNDQQKEIQLLKEKNK
jgi:hypothetical protein